MTRHAEAACASARGNAQRRRLRRRRVVIVVVTALFRLVVRSPEQAREEFRVSHALRHAQREPVRAQRRLIVCAVIVPKTIVARRQRVALRLGARTKKSHETERQERSFGQTRQLLCAGKYRVVARQ